MRPSRAAVILTAATFTLALLARWPAALALQQRQETSRFDPIAIPDPSAAVSPATLVPEAAQVPESIRAGWKSFKTANGPAWDVYIDGRSGAPLLVQGQGIPVIPGSGNSLHSAAAVTLGSLAGSLRSFMSRNASVLAASDDELVVNTEGSGQVTPDLWKVVFDRSVAGVPVAGDRYIFYVGHGNIIAFGAPRWSPVRGGTVPTLAVEDARAMLFDYMHLTPADSVDFRDRGSLLLLPIAAAGSANESFEGAVGNGYRTALAWRFELEVAGEPGAWEALVDAHTGAVLGLSDTIKYATAKGGVFPVTDDAICPDGCEVGNFPMPFTNITIGANSSTAGSMGGFACTPGGSSATTTLAGQYVRVSDTCGAISVATTCDSDLDLKTSTGTDCTVPAGTSAGDTHASRSSFYHLNRIKEHARAWLPANTWLQAQLTDNVNINLTCNAFWNSGGATGTVNFYRSGGGCRNTGEIASVFLHEWGHGLDQNDGGGYDNPTEAYADVTSLLLTHRSCIGRGFTSSNCSGYGNACLACTGVREQDWNQRASHAPSTPEGFVASCPTGGTAGPCGKEGHCEAYLPGETLWDLAARDLPASGVDQQTSWQIADRLWYKSRTGAGGNAYSCGSPASGRSCAAANWMTELRTVDDDDGNLANGTPHAAAIFAAFNRHNIPCGAVGDASNQSTSSCPALAAPTLTVNGSPNSIGLSWTPVAGAASYNIFRNDQGCGWGYNLLANVAGTSYTDTSLPNSFPLYYSIQAVGSNTACLGTLSTCTSAQAGGPHASYQSNARVADTCGAGGAGNNDGIYDAGEQIQFSVTLTNDGVTTLTGVTAIVTSSTPGVTMTDGTASYANIAPGANGTSLAPHFTAQLPSGLACGSTVNYSITINANEGSWSGAFTQTVGQVIPASGTALSENFSGGIPGTWTIVNGGSGGSLAATWTTANPGSRTFTAPITSPVAIVDSDNAGSSATQDEQLITPVLNLSTAISVTLDYDEFFRWYNLGQDEKGDVDVMSSLTGGAWVNVVRNQGASNPSGATTTGAAHRTVNITAQAAGAANVQLRFHYYNAQFEWWWEVDNVVVTYTTAGTCNMHPCLGAICGNGIVESGEQCDDHNTANGDCCSSTCQYEASGSSCGSSTSNTCTAPDTCNATGSCQANNAPNGTACNDANACTQTDTCQAGVCTGGNPVTCTASDPCHVAGVCNPATGLCSNPSAPNGTPCNDGNACTQTDTCQSGACTGSNPITCTASDPCHVAGVCNPSTGACSNPSAPDGTPCTDDNACTSGDTCSSGVCQGGAPVNCDDANPCTVDSCHADHGCDHIPGYEGEPCSDQNACTTGDVCGNDGICHGTPVVCAPSDQCHSAGTCNPGTGVCSNPQAPNGTSCNDGNACTQSDTCQSGTCTGGSAVTCTASDACHVAGTCDPGTGCSNPPAPDNTPCDDGNACTGWPSGGFDHCEGGACIPGGPVQATDGNPCTTDYCDPQTGTHHVPNTDPCDDGNPCTVNDTCANTVCVSGPAAGAPSEVGNQRFTDATHQAWDAAASGGGPSPVYDVVSGLVSDLPVGGGGSEQCLASQMSGTVLEVTDTPSAGDAFWYLVRGRNACGTGDYGVASDNTPRTTSACP